jgi:CubicO group peptidase (beta-lactamase class C family)
MKKQFIALILISIIITVSLSPIVFGLTKTTKQIKLSEENIQPESNHISDLLFDFYIKILMKIGHKPSIAAGIIYNNTLVWSKGYGYYDIENQKHATKDTLYLQASVSKTVTATAIMQLYEKGKFNLSDDVNDYLPFKLRNPNHPDLPITFEMILSHRSSLADDNLYWLCLSYLPGDPDCIDYPYPWFEEYFTPNGSAYSSSTWSDAKPGEEYYYANVGFSLIGYLVEILSNQNFNDYCKEHIFEPLQMYNSSFRLKDHNISNIAVPYEFKNGGYFRHPHYGIHLIYPAITLRTSIEEYSHFIIAHMNGGVYKGVRILNESTVELMHTAHFSQDDKYNYGLGWQITRKSFGKIQIGHSGGYVGAHDIVTIKPEKNIAVILFSNELDSELLGTKIERYAFSHLYKALFLKANRIAS